MSSNIRLQKVCEECGEVFTAKTTVTRFCSHRCGCRNHKQRGRNFRIEVEKKKFKEIQIAQILTASSKLDIKKNVPSRNFNSPAVGNLAKELLDIQEIALVIGISERTLHRLLKDQAFPRLRIGKRILFQKENVLQYLNHKYAKT